MTGNLIIRREGSDKALYGVGSLGEDFIRCEGAIFSSTPKKEGRDFRVGRSYCG